MAVIGGGPAGMMAAGRAAECGAKVILIERNPKLGRKLLMAGGGRCNLTNAKSEREFISALGENGKFLWSSYHVFGASEVREFFASRGLETKIENNDRVFPVTNRGDDVLSVLQEYLRVGQVKIMAGCKIVDLKKKGNQISKIITEDGEIEAGAYVLATGGLSYVVTGSTGDGLKWAKKLGHTVVAPRPALVPIITQEKIVQELQGLSFADVGMAFWQSSKKILQSRGEMLFTHEGVSGPMILNASSQVGASLAGGAVEMRLDFFPDEAVNVLDEKVANLFLQNQNRSVKNCLSILAPEKLVCVILKIIEIKEDRKANSITRDERQKIAMAMKNFGLHVASLGNLDTAMVTAGGVALSEVDQKTMKSKIIDNLYFAGEVLDLDGPTGGFNLQICWSTGYVAGEAAIPYLRH